MAAKDGDIVKVHYTLKDANGEIVETSIKSLPLEFTIGEGKVIPGFEKAVTGMKLNEKKSIEVSPEDAYGLHDEKKIFDYDRSKAPKDFNPQIGQTIQMHRPDGNSFPVTIMGETEKGYKCDANHPLAGKKLNFDIELIEIVS